MANLTRSTWHTRRRFRATTGRDGLVREVAGTCSQATPCASGQCIAMLASLTIDSCFAADAGICVETTEPAGCFCKIWGADGENSLYCWR